jgi:hypothetical protein
MAHRPILVRPSPPGNRRRGRRPGSTFCVPTWADFCPKQRCSSILNQRRREILGTTKPVCRPIPRNPSSLQSFTPPKTHESARRLRRWHHLRVCSAASVLPEGERAVIEPSHGGALRQILWVAKNYGDPGNPSSRSLTSTGRWIRSWLRSKAAPRGDLDIERRNTTVV